jgi:hypothetical protein
MMFFMPSRVVLQAKRAMANLLILLMEYEFGTHTPATLLFDRSLICTTLSREGI